MLELKTSITVAPHRQFAHDLFFRQSRELAQCVAPTFCTDRLPLDFANIKLRMPNLNSPKLQSNAHFKDLYMYLYDMFAFAAFLKSLAAPLTSAFILTGF